MGTHKLGLGYILNTEQLKLMRYGERIVLQSRFAKVLVHLVENQDRIVTQDELIERMWLGNYTLGSKRILRAISAIRKALRDNVSNPKFIITHRQKGYQFVPQEEQPLNSDNARYASSFMLP